MIYPTHVGLNRRRQRPFGGVAHLPHARGVEPVGSTRNETMPAFTPRTWG